jgi:aspartate aminotransferase-like enzyme
MSYKLFIPGPIAVSEKTLRAMAQPMIGHRSTDFVALYQSLQPALQELLYTKDGVYLSTSSAWGAMEGSIRNVVKRKVLNCMNGAFSDKWFDVSQRCGKQAGALKSEWGQPVDPEALRKELSTGQYDAVTLIHNETSCGCMSDLPALMAVIREFPEVISIVDTVSSFSAVPIKKDELGIDVFITGTQKALALPPGMALLSVSKRALDRAATINDRGYYFDFLEFQKNHEQGMTPSTPVIPLIYALKSKLEDIKAEGLENRYARHARLNKTVRDWAYGKGFKLFPQEKYGSISLNCFANNQNIDLAALNKTLKSKHKLVIDGGYGKLKGKTFRISNMGDETDATIAELIKALDSALAETPKLAAS